MDLNKNEECKYLELFKMVNDIRNKQDEVNKKTGANFNVFNILNDNSDEVKICRLIYELINPNGCHNQGTLFLKLFLKDVLDIEVSDYELSNIKVNREQLLNNSRRRMDLVIETLYKFIPIEVKIYSGDQYLQLHDYYLDAQYNDKVCDKIYYLTLFGVEPTEYSTNLEIDEHVISISFKNEINKWIEDCINTIEKLKINNIKVILEQFLQVIKSLTNLVEEEVEMNLKNLIISSKENLKACVEIDKSIDSAKIYLMKRFFDLLDIKLKENNINKIENHPYDYKYKDYEKCERYYDIKNSTWPGISIPFKNKGDDGLTHDIWVRVEIGDSLFVGYCVPVNGEYIKENKPMQEIGQHVKYIPGSKYDNSKYSWWLFKEDVIINNSEILFKSMNDNFLNLVDKEKMNETVEETFNVIKKYLENK